MPGFVFKFIIYLLCACLYKFMCKQMSIGGKKRVPDRLELDGVQEAVHCLVWAMGTELRTSAGAANTLILEPSLQP